MAEILANALKAGAVLSLAMGALIVFILWWRPRAVLHHYPQAIQARVAPRTAAENRVVLVFMMVSLPLVFGLPVAATAWLDLDPLQAFVQAALTVLILNLFDLVVIDWLLFCTMRPAFLVLLGTTDAPEYRDYRHHAVGFLRGLPLVVSVGGLAAIIGVFANA